MKKHICLLLLVFFSIAVFSPVQAGWMNKAKNSIRRSTRKARNSLKHHIYNFKKNTRKTYYRTRKKVRNSLKHHIYNFKKNTRKTYYRTNKRARKKAEEIRRWTKKRARKANYFAKKHGRIAVDNIRSASKKIGRKAANTLKKIYEREGRKAADFLYNLHPKVKKSMLYVYENYGRKNYYRIKHLYNRRGGRKYGQEASLVAYRARKYIKNPVNQKKAVRAIVASAIIVYEIKVNGKQMVANEARHACRKIYIVDRRGRKVNLEQYSQNWVAYNAPYLQGTSIAEDPIGTVTYVMIFQDTNYVTSEMKIVKDPENGEYISMKQALVQTSPLESGQRSAILKNIEAFETLTDDDASADDIRLAYGVIQNVNQVME